MTHIQELLEYLEYTGVPSQFIHEAEQVKEQSSSDVS